MKKQVVLCVCAAVSIILIFVCMRTELAAKTKASLGSITSESIKEKEAGIKAAQQQKENIQSAITDINAILGELNTLKGDLKNYVKQLDASLMELEQKITNLDELITVKENEIAVTTAELEEAQEIEEEQYESMKQRIRFMYEKGEVYYLELLLTADSFSDMLNKADYIEELSAYDRKMLKEYQETCAYIDQCKQQLEADKELLAEARSAVEEERKTMESLIVTKEQEIKNYESDINNKEAAIKELQAEAAAQDAEIKMLEQAVAEEKKRLAAANGYILTYDGGMFKWPAPDHTRISDEYGMRMHPILNVEQFHNGIDMAAPSGSPILAAYDGVVVDASYSTTMGNYVMIDHGDSLYTIYMHASALYVAKGDLVVKGQKIAAVGSTGRSTGPHLHFSVRLKGSYVSPWNYLKIG